MKTKGRELLKGGMSAELPIVSEDILLLELRERTAWARWSVPNYYFSAISSFVSLPGCLVISILFFTLEVTSFVLLLRLFNF